MKNFKLILLLVPAFAMGLTEAGSGKMFGATFGGTLLGTTLGNAITRPSRTVVVREDSDSRLTNKAVRQLNGDIELLFEKMDEMRKAVRTLSDEVTDLKSEVSKLKRNKSSDDVVEVKKSKKRKMEEEETPKKAKYKNWFSSSKDNTEEVED